MYNVWHPIKNYRYANKLKNTTPAEEDNQPIQMVRALAEIMEIADKDVRGCKNCSFDVPLQQLEEVY